MKDILLLLIACLFCFILLLGCSGRQKIDTSNMTDAAKKDTILGITKIEGTFKQAGIAGWLTPAFILAGVVGLFILLSKGDIKGLWLAISAAVGCVWVRSDQAVAENNWMLLLPVGLIMLGVGFYIYTEFIEKRMRREVVEGVEQYRLLKDKPIELETILEDTQSKSTKKLIKEIKG